MHFQVLPPTARPPPNTTSAAFLKIDDWDDWFRFSTMYVLIVADSAGAVHTIGAVKIGQFGMQRDQRRPSIPEQFEVLSPEFFSLGQDDSYYERLNGLGETIRDEILVGLRDVAFDRELFERALGEKVTGVSLLRSVSAATVRGQFNRLARGGARLSNFAFSYAPPDRPVKDSRSILLTFDVEPESKPPTNIHVLIGRNGVGKTRILNLMSRALVDEGADQGEVGAFAAADLADESLFVGLVSVTFSAFDPFEPLPDRQDRASGMRYSYIGLRRVGTSDAKPTAPKSPASLSREFSTSVRVCKQGERLPRWRRALQMLESDPIFADAQVADLASAEEDEVAPKALVLFNALSSGHKIVLLTTTRLVEVVEERSLVLIDEPEAHLHPPLLSAFVRALSDLLIDRNGVAIIATHSPVVLQEVPKNCVWKIRRSGHEVVIERPEIETFGENVGVLTREVFGLEVTNSGFHRLLRESIDAAEDYGGVIDSFKGELGSEAKAIARALIEDRRRERE